VAYASKVLIRRRQVLRDAILHFNPGVDIMMEMTVKEMEQVSGGGGRVGGGGDIGRLHGNDSDDAASLLGRKPGVGMGSVGVAGSATTPGGRGGIGGEV
jgi:hypothetical protein